MAYTEIKEKGGRKYYYRVKSVRKGKKVGKKRVYLGVNLEKKKLSKSESEADKKLMLLSTLLNEGEKKELEKIRKDYISSKDISGKKYEAFVSLFTYDSTNIEGNTLTLQETSQLLFEGITPRKPIREIREVINHKEAFDFIINWKKDINKKFILKLHKLVVKDTLKPDLSNQVGKYRTLQVYIRGVEWLPPKVKDIPKEMGKLFSWYSKNKKSLHPLILSAYFHSAFEMIHPFVDGNGRVGRLLMNFMLHKNNFPMINIPNKKKYLYYNTLESAQVNGDLMPLVKFLYDLLRSGKIQF